MRPAGSQISAIYHSRPSIANFPGGFRARWAFQFRWTNADPRPEGSFGSFRFPQLLTHQPVATPAEGRFSKDPGALLATGAHPDVGVEWSRPSAGGFLVMSVVTHLRSNKPVTAETTRRSA